MAREGGGGNGDTPGEEEFHRFVAEARTDLAARERARERWLRVQAEESATFVGVLLDLTESGQPVTLTTTMGRRLAGRIVAIGADFVMLEPLSPSEGLERTFVAMHAIGTVSSPGRQRAGDRHEEDAPQGTLQEALAELAPDRPHLVVRSLTGEEVAAGELRSVGRDVAMITSEGRGTGFTYLRLSSAAELSVIVSG